MHGKSHQFRHAFVLMFGALIAGSGMPRTIASQCLAALVPNRQVEALCEMLIEFATPTDWRCTHADNCTVCRNLSEHASELQVHCAGDDTRERHLVPPGAELSICSGEVRRMPRAAALDE
ncbi:MAG TPA: hypothetical protein VMW17_00585 [Candidatus Binatia bacterium]|nr:hypothetical protein [Candidatus Binatia bacterium]